MAIAECCASVLETVCWQRRRYPVVVLRLLRRREILPWTEPSSFGKRSGRCWRRQGRFEEPQRQRRRAKKRTGCWATTKPRLRVSNQRGPSCCPRCCCRCWLVSIGCVSTDLVRDGTGTAPPQLAQRTRPGRWRRGSSIWRQCSWRAQQSPSSFVWWRRCRRASFRARAEKKDCTQRVDVSVCLLAFSTFFSW